jgi:hypothetical protein
MISIVFKVISGSLGRGETLLAARQNSRHLLRLEPADQQDRHIPRAVCVELECEKSA